MMAKKSASRSKMMMPERGRDAMHAEAHKKMSSDEDSSRSMDTRKPKKKKKAAKRAS